MKNKCYKYEWGKRGRNKTRQGKGKEDKVILESVWFFPAMSTVAQINLRSSSMDILPSLCLSGFPCAVTQGCAASVLQPWGEATAPLRGKHWASSQHEDRNGNCPFPLPDLQRALMRSWKKLTIAEASQEGRKTCGTQQLETDKPEWDGKKPNPPFSGFASC